MEDLNFRKGDAKTEAFGSNRMLQPCLLYTSDAADE